MEEKKKFYIALSRQFGSGGAETASKLAVKLGIKCYDKTLAEMTSVVTGLCRNLRTPSRFSAAWERKRTRG